MSRKWSNLTFFVKSDRFWQKSSLLTMIREDHRMIETKEGRNNKKMYNIGKVLCLESGQIWRFLSKVTIFVKNGHFWQKMSNSTTFEMQYLSEVIYFLFLLFETNVLSYLPPFYHNFENLTLYGIYTFFTPLPIVNFDLKDFLLLKSYF